MGALDISYDGVATYAQLQHAISLAESMIKPAIHGPSSSQIGEANQRKEEWINLTQDVVALNRIMNNVYMRFGEALVKAGASEGSSSEDLDDIINMSTFLSESALDLKSIVGSEYNQIKTYPLTKDVKKTLRSVSSELMVHLAKTSDLTLDIRQLLIGASGKGPYFHATEANLNAMVQEAEIIRNKEYVQSDRGFVEV